MPRSHRGPVKPDTAEKGRTCGRPRQAGVVPSRGEEGGVYRLRPDSFQLYSHGDLPIKAPLPEVYQGKGEGHWPGLFIQLRAHLINTAG